MIEFSHITDICSTLHRLADSLEDASIRKPLRDVFRNLINFFLYCCPFFFLYCSDVLFRIKSWRWRSYWRRSTWYLSLYIGISWVSMVTEKKRKTFSLSLIFPFALKNVWNEGDISLIITILLLIFTYWHWSATMVLIFAQSKGIW